MCIRDSLISKLHNEHKIPILVGGSAFYIRALIKGMYDGTSISDETRSTVDQTLKEKGFSYIREELARIDPNSYQSLHENDEYRNIRAYEFYLQTGHPISKEKNKIQDPYDFQQTGHPEWDVFHIYLDIPKEEHWKIIEKRTYKMLEQGLLSEVSSLLKSNLISGEEKSLQSIGYKETVEFLQKENMKSKEDLAERIYISTRQLAKSQKTFFKKIKPKQTYHPLKDRDKIMTEGLQFLLKY